MTTLIAGTCLALGIGVNAGVFSVVEAALLRPLPFSDPARLLLVQTVNDQNGTPVGLSPDAYDFFAHETDAFTGTAAAQPAEFDLSGDGVPERVSGALVTPGFFAVLGVDMVAGRAFGGAGDEVGAPQVAVISERLWRSRFGADPAVVGTDVRLDGSAYRIVGVCPGDARYPPQADIWTPLDLDVYQGVARTNGFLSVLARVRSDVSSETAVEQATRAGADFKRRNPEWIADRFTAGSVREPQVATVRPVLLVVMVGVGILLAMACLNVASLLLVQARRDAATLALRAALGANPGRLVLEESTRHVLLGVVGAGVGVAAAVPLVGGLTSLAVIDVPGFRVGMDLRVLGFTAGLALLVSVAVGILPALAAARTAPGGLIDRSRGGSGGRGARRLQNAVVGGQVAMGTFLLVAAWAVGAQVVRMQNADPGFRVDDVLTARIGAPDARFPDLEARVLFLTQVTDRLSSLPGVRSVGGASSTHIGDPEVFWSFSIEDQPPTDAADMHAALGRMALPGYIETMGIDVLAGRPILASDRDGAEPVVVVNEAFQDAYWPGQSALGKRIKRRTYDSPFPWLRVVGVVENVREHDLSTPLGPTIYFPYAQHYTPAGGTVTLVLRTAAGAASADAVRRAVMAVDPDAAVFRILTMRERITESLGQRRLGATLMAAFGALGLILSLVGVYGVVSESVTRRTRELGVRLALGATPVEVVRTTLLGAGALAVLGVVTGGLALAAVAPQGARLLPGLTVGASKVAGVAAVLILAVLAAALGPALRAARTDVVRALVAEG
jgi:predicted permease